MGADRTIVQVTILASWTAPPPVRTVLPARIGLQLRLVYLPGRPSSGVKIRLDARK